MKYKKNNNREYPSTINLCVVISEEVRMLVDENLYIHLANTLIDATGEFFVKSLHEFQTIGREPDYQDLLITTMRSVYIVGALSSWEGRDVERKFTSRELKSVIYEHLYVCPFMSDDQFVVIIDSTRGIEFTSPNYMKFLVPRGLYNLH